MFGCSAKIKELKSLHQREIDRLKSENERLEEEIQELRKPPVVKGINREELIEILLKSYDTNNVFLKKV